MKAVVTSIGEHTTDLCIWSLERNGFEVKLYQDGSSLWDKLKHIYNDLDEDFLRVDADVIVNRKCTPDYMDKAFKDISIWWCQFLTWDWYKQDSTHGGIQYIRKQTLPYLCQQVDEAEYKERPESYMYRIQAFHNPRRCVTQDVLMGLHGFGISDIDKAKEVKARRDQLTNYDFELTERLNELAKIYHDASRGN